MLNGVGARGEVLVEHVAVEADAAFPGDRRRIRIDADLLEFAHIAPQLEGADLEQVAEEHAALESVLEAQPQFVVLLGLACRDSMHLIPLLVHVAPPHSQFKAPPVWYSMTRVSKKLRSFLSSIISLIQGKGFCAPAYSVSSPTSCQRRLAT